MNYVSQNLIGFSGHQRKTDHSGWQPGPNCVLSRFIWPASGSQWDLAAYRTRLKLKFCCTPRAAAAARLGEL